jgi:hypothetical protein
MWCLLKEVVAVRFRVCSSSGFGSQQSVYYIKENFLSHKAPAFLAQSSYHEPACHKLTWDSSHVVLRKEIDDLFWKMDMKALS